MSDSVATILQILQILAIIGVGISAWIALRVAQATLSATVTSLSTDIIDIKADLKKFGDVLVTMAVTSKRLDNLEEDVRDLKHGEGFIFPLNKRVPP